VPSKIGVLFMRVMPYLKEYSLYVNRYRYSLSTLQECRKRKDFEAWIQVNTIIKYYTIVIYANDSFN
jgi:hypothetical protein